MTVKEALAQAFDEAFVMDAMPGNDMPKNTLQQKPNAPSGLKKNVAAAPGANETSGGEKSLSQHIQEGCEATKNGHPERCPYIKKMAKDLEKSQGLDADAAMQQAIGIHTTEAAKIGGGGAQQQESIQPQPKSPEMLEQQVQQIAQNPQMIEQIQSEMLPETKMVQTEAGELPAQTTVQEGILENLTEQAASGNTIAEESLQELKDKVEDGTITQKEDYDADDNELALASEERAKEKQWSRAESEAQGTIYLDKKRGSKETAIPQPKTFSAYGRGNFIINASPEEVAIMQSNPEKEQVFQQIVNKKYDLSKVGTNRVAASDTERNWDIDRRERARIEKEIEALKQKFYSDSNIPERQRNDEKPTQLQQISTSDGKGSREITPDEALVLASNPEKKEIFQEMIDIEGKVGDSRLKNDSPEFKDLANQYQTLQRMFFGNETKGEEGASPNSPSPEITPESADGVEGGESKAPTDAPQEEAEKTPNPIEPPSDSPKQTSAEKPSEKKDEPNTSTQSTEGNPANHGAPTPSDSEFQIGKNKYNVGGTVYTDVSGKGLLRSMISAFMAGLRGEDIITGWDRISGAWDQIKRSEKGEMVRDGISGALIQNVIANNAAKEGLSEDAKMEIDLINEMYSKAKTPNQKMAAVKEFQKWKDKYKEELGERGNHSDDKTFSPLPNTYKGTTPPVSILGEPKGYNVDTEYGEQVASAIQDRLTALGFPISDDKPEIHVGPSATTIEFSVPPIFDMAMAKSSKTKEALKGAIGAPVSSIGYSSGKKDTLSITITNKEMRPVYFADVMHSNAWKKFSKNAKVPMALGKDSKGDDKLLDLTKLPHLKVTGATRSGKSVFLLSAMNSAEIAKPPSELRIVCIDPKEEFASQKGSPHLLYPIPSKKRDIANVVASLKAEMEKRISMIGGTEDAYDPEKNEFAGNSDRNIDGYNQNHPGEKIPHIMVVFDEFADCMKDPVYGKQIEADMDRIMALGRSVGINCILATQRDDVASISGAIQANMPAHLAFRASQDDAKASKEAKSLAGNGDYLLNADGEVTRGRGCFITDENVAAVPAYYRDHMNGATKPTAGDGYSGGGEGQQLPQEHLDSISVAIEKGNPVSMEAAEGFLDAFKNAFPSDWEITEEEIDGEKHWKASPPKKSDAEGEGEGSSSSSEGEGSPSQEETKNENTDWRKDGSREDAIATLSKVKDAAKAKAWDTYNQGDDTAEAQKKLQKALEKADSDFNTKMALVDMKFPPPEDENLDDEGPEEGDEDEPSSPNEGDDSDEDSPAATMKDIEETFNAERERIEKALAKTNTKVRDKQKLREERKALKKRFSEAKAKFEAGGSAPDMLDIFEPEENKPSDNGGSPEEGEESTDEEKEAAALKAQTQKDEKLRSTVREQKFYGAPGFKATSKVTQQQIKQMENLIPAGWEFVTDNQFKAPARTKNGVVFIRHPSNGSYGRIFIKRDEKGKEYIEPEAQIDVDTTHPNYQGFVKNEDGTYGLTEEGKKAEAEYKRIRKYSKSEKEKAEVQKKFNRIRFGHDEAPDNMTIVANAVANVLEQI